MVFRFSRRRMMQGVGSVALAQSLETAEAAPTPRQWPIVEGPDTPKICLSMGDAGGPLPASVQPPAPSAPAPAAAGAAAGRGGRGGGGGGGYGGLLAPRTEPAPAAPANAAGRGGPGGFGGNPAANYQRILQLGVTHLLGVNIGGSPWTEENVRRVVESAKAAGLVAYNAMLGIPNSIIYGRDTRAKDMEVVIASLEAAGKGGLAVAEYNFYAHRAVEGYYETVGRARAGYTGFDYDIELLVNENGGVVSPIYRDENVPDHARDPGRLSQRQEGEVQGPAAVAQ